MDFTISSFRAAFAEFGDSTKYPDAMIEFWANLAEDMLPKRIWKKQWVTAVSLYVAHEITLNAASVQTAANGGTPGQNSGIASQKAVGQVSVSYDSQSTAEKDAGWWNLTNYGKQLYRLIKIFGAGCYQL